MQGFRDIHLVVRIQEPTMIRPGSDRKHGFNTVALVNGGSEAPVHYQHGENEHAIKAPVADELL